MGQPSVEDLGRRGCERGAVRGGVGSNLGGVDPGRGEFVGVADQPGLDSFVVGLEVELEAGTPSRGASTDPEPSAVRVSGP